MLGARTSVGEKAQLTQCFTQPGYEVAAEGASFALDGISAGRYPQRRSKARSWTVWTRHGERRTMMRTTRRKSRTPQSDQAYQ